MKICIVHVFFGEWPSWFTVFLKSCRGTGVDFLIVTDSKNNNFQANNLNFLYLSMAGFNKKATIKLGFDIQIKNAYKLCDLKPCYGKIFEDELTTYEVWGYCDSDIVLGDLKTFFSDVLMETYDVVSFQRGFPSGAFCCLRNRKDIVNLYTTVHKYQKKLSYQDYTGFDENIMRKKYKGISVVKLVFYIMFIFSKFFLSTIKFFSIKEFRFQFQWFYKRLMLNSNDIIDFSEAVYNAQRKGQIKCLFRDNMISDAYYKRINKKNWIVKWKNGTLTEDSCNMKMLIFHFRVIKQQESFQVSKTVSSNFEITKNGIEFK